VNIPGILPNRYAVYQIARLLSSEQTIRLARNDCPDQAISTESSSQARYNVSDQAFWTGSPCNHFTRRVQWHNCVKYLAEFAKALEERCQSTPFSFRFPV
jgi:hypothetical protein